MQVGLSKSTCISYIFIFGGVIMDVLKRDGSEVQFDLNKIINALTNANASVLASERISDATIDRKSVV